MQYTVTENGGVCAINGKGTITFEDHGTFRTLIDTVLASDATTVSFDLQAVSALDSAGIGLLLLINDKMKSAGKDLTLSKPSPTARKIMDIAKLGEVVQVDY